MARKRKEKNPPKPVKLPPILAAGIVVPIFAGFALVAWLTRSAALGLIGGIVAGVLYWIFMPRLKGESPDAVKPTKIPEDILENILSKYGFESCETADIRRPEAVSLDGLRWSQLIRFTAENGEQDVFMARGSLVTGEGSLEVVNGWSTYTPEDWETAIVGEANPELSQELIVDESGFPLAVEDSVQIANEASMESDSEPTAGNSNLR